MMVMWCKSMSLFMVWGQFDDVEEEEPFVTDPLLGRGRRVSDDSRWGQMCLGSESSRR